MKLKSSSTATHRSRSEQREERKKRIIQVTVSLFLVFLLLFSYIAYYFTPDQNTIRENGFKITPNVDSLGYIQGYTTKVNGTKKMFYTAPSESQNIALPEGMIAELQSAPFVAVLFNPNDTYVGVYDQMRFDFSANLNTNVLSAVTEESPKYSQLTTIACGNESNEITMILLAEGNRSITREGGCYVLRGGQYDFGALRDRVLYAYYGITTN